MLRIDIFRSQPAAAAGARAVAFKVLLVALLASSFSDKEVAQPEPAPSPRALHLPRLSLSFS